MSKKQSTVSSESMDRTTIPDLAGIDRDFEQHRQSELQQRRRLTGKLWKYALGRATREFSRNKCTDLAASLTYFTMLSIFPALLAVVSMLGVVGQAEETTQTLLSLLREFASDQVVSTLKQPIEQLTAAPSAGFALVVGLVGAVWSASGYVGAFGRALNQIYSVHEGRSFFKLKPVLLMVTIFLLLAVAVMAILFILSGTFAQKLGNFIGLGETALAVWNIAKWPVMIIFAVMLVAVLYYGTPNVKAARFRVLSAGAFVALVVLGLATVGFFYYVSNFGSYNKTYGAIGGVIVLLLWIWIANQSLLFGAVLDVELERARELSQGERAGRSLQLEPREAAGIVKHEEKLERDVQRAESLRLTSEISAEDQAEKKFWKDRES
ncbi:YihY/virulence factor BrkB family protein [Glutamicibacter sp.]|uniref:YihY/virulence factor BrkB family protein n=1 Tax=Glutamicibacter sp. TaxID=1931995 RepID=UPI0028BE1FA5|nr:YihY/virulence factor BrkB family protein [Glutamicibacter sp.]